MEENVNVTQVEIMGESYTLRTNDDPEYVRRVARYVDAKFREIKGASPSISYIRIAVLVALNIADELHKLKSQEEDRDKQIQEKMNQIVSLVEKELAATP